MNGTFPPSRKPTGSLQASVVGGWGPAWRKRTLLANHPESEPPREVGRVGYNHAHVWRLGPEQN